MLLKVLVFYGIAVIGGAHAASGWFNFHAAPPILAGISPGISGGGGSGNSGGIEGGGKLSTGGGSAIGIGLGGTFTWPQGRIPFLDDPALMANPDQAVALNNARMDLQVRTCLRFIPRKTEEDYVYFTDLGLQIE
ncbi:hypothetical protein AAVH_16639 [Aphelenchoides avenae]|nr:hypothetical protein AAVH_16639 [Aphelenchus avenae]